jgi:hypothetical protein
MSEQLLEVPALDLTRYRNVYRHGDITVYETWWMADRDGPQPCLALVPSHARADQMVPCVVTLSDAWKWSEEIGDPRYAVHACFEFAKALGLSTSKATNIVRIRSMIVDHLGDLVSMPPIPQGMLRELITGEAKLTTHDDGKTRHVELKERV